MIPGQSQQFFEAAAAQAGASEYEIERSLRFNSDDSAYLNRTPSVSGNRKTWTWSGWVKRSNITATQVLFMCEISFSEFAQLAFNSSDQLQSYLDDDDSGGQVINATSAVFRDTSAWYHVVWSVDSTQATAADRVKLYVNGVDQSYTGGNIPQNGDHAINSTTNHSIGIRLYNNADKLDAYLADVHFIDGQALAASDFGEYDDNNVWQPKEYSGSYGTNGFYLKFDDNSSDAALGTDSSGNNNTWTVNNISAIEAIGAIYAEYSGSSNQYLRNNSGNVLPGSNGAFTIECHFYPHTTNVIGLFDGGSGQTSIMRNYGNNTIEKQSGGSVSFAGDYTQNAWNHIAVVYTGSTGTDTLTVYVNGVSSGSSSGLNGFTPGSTFDVGVINGGGDGRFDGYIRNFRVTHSAVYTSDFTAPSHTDNLTALTDTKLLVITTPALGLTGAGPGTTLGMSNNNSVSTGTLIAASQTDSFIDSPTDYEADSGNNGGNYCTMNPLDVGQGTQPTFSNGNLEIENTGSNVTWTSCRGTIGMKTGKWYFEWTNRYAGGGLYGIANAAASTNPVGTGTGGWTWGGANRYFNGSSSGTGLSNHAVSDVIQIAFDADTGKLWFGRNNTFYDSSWGTTGDPGAGTNNTTSVTTGVDYFPALANLGSSGQANADPSVFNAGQRPFAYTPPTNFKSLCTQNLTDSTIAEGSTVMDTTTYTGNNTFPRSITGLGFSPDFVWTKTRSQAYRHMLFDTVRGVGKNLTSNNNNAETTNDDYGYISAFNSDGWTIAEGAISGENFNANTETYVAWAWDGGDLVTTSSSSYNQTRTWSDNAVGGRPDEPIEDLFDGSTSTFAQNPSGGSNPNNIVVTFSPGLAYTSSVEVYPQNASSCAVNNGSQTATTNNQWNTVASGSGTLTELDFQRNHTNGCSVAAIRVDGKILINLGVIPVGSIRAASTVSSGNDFSAGYAGHSPVGTWSNTDSWSGLPAYSSGQKGYFSGTETLSNGSVISAAATPKPFNAVANGSQGFVLRASATVTIKFLVQSNTTEIATTSSDSQTFGDRTIVATNPTAGTYVEATGKCFWWSGNSNNPSISIMGTLYDAPALPTIASTVRANQTAGCSVVSYTSTDVAGATVGHGLNAVMDFAIFKNRDKAQNWLVYHKSLDITSGEAINLNQTAAAYASAAQFNSTLATSSVFTLGTGGNASYEAGDDIIAYCFAPVEGYSAFGSYTGNGSTDGPFVFTGMRPRWIMIKNADSTGSWAVYDTSRDDVNVATKRLFANVSSAESDATGNSLDILSNGFKVRSQGNVFNDSSTTYIYAAFAEHPFKTARAR